MIVSTSWIPAKENNLFGVSSVLFALAHVAYTPFCHHQEFSPRLTLSVNTLLTVCAFTQWTLWLPSGKFTLTVFLHSILNLFVYTVIKPKMKVTGIHGYILQLVNLMCNQIITRIHSFRKCLQRWLTPNMAWISLNKSIYNSII